MFVVPYTIVRILCVMCFVLNAISIGLCLSALFLLTVAFLNLGHLFGQSDHPPQTIWNPGDISINQSTTVNVSALLSLANLTSTGETETLQEAVPLPESNPNQFNMIIYLLFYLAAAVLGVMGATTRYKTRKVYLLVAHVLLLFAIICFNLLAWFHFRSYSPLNASPYDDLHLLLASLFDFFDFLIGLSLLVALLLNRGYVKHKQRNSIGPIIDQ